jgi:GNAT superfamily N-acetyltransferase
MPPLTDPAAVRAVLETDRPWAVYALGDLAPQHFRHCSWFRAAGEPPALVLLYRAFATPVLFALGRPQDVRPLLGELGDVPEMFLHVRPEILSLLAADYVIRNEATMARMLLEPARFRPAPAANVARLGTADLPALQRLYADGAAAGESPDFFAPAMLAEGVYFGVREAGELVAAAGTHLAVPEEGVGAVGNVYTRRDRRGRGLAGQVTSAVAAELLRQQVRTVALNVNRHNAAAIRVYERLGFVSYCPFKEGRAVKPSEPEASAKCSLRLPAFCMGRRKAW